MPNSLPLFDSAPLPVATRGPRSTPERWLPTRPLPAPTLWLCLHLPQLPLEVRTRGLPASRACVLVEGEGTRRRVLMANTRAATLGIRAGMPVGAAHALGEVVELERSLEAEQAALTRLAHWAMQFSPLVSLVAPDGVLLEVRGSLRLFQGVEGLLTRLRQGLKQLGYRAQYAVAPTPLAATALARVSARAVVEDMHELPRHLAGLPLAALRLAPAEEEALASVGVRTVGECRRLARADLARRLSPALLDHFDKLHGLAPDPRAALPVPNRFESRLELPWEVSHAQALVIAGERLLHELQGFLRGHNAVTRLLRWRLRDRSGHWQSFELRLTRPGREQAHMLLLLRETLMRMSLAAPVTAMELLVDDLVQGRPGEGADLFGQRPAAQGEAYAAFLDRLRARCGEEALRGVALEAAHRPEAAWRWRQGEGLTLAQRVGARGLSGAGRQARPLWLVREPLTLPTHEGIPHFEGPLTLAPERERIEAGWWEGPAPARDYFVARTSRGGRLWVYKELEGEQRWRLHGVFE